VAVVDDFAVDLDAVDLDLEVVDFVVLRVDFPVPALAANNSKAIASVISSTD